MATVGVGCSWKRAARLALAALAPALTPWVAAAPASGAAHAPAAGRASAAGAAGTATVLAPLPSSDYGVRPACAARPGRAACQALVLVPLAAEARAHRHPLGMPHAAPRSEPSPAEGDYGLTPGDLHSAYQLPTDAPSNQTIALVDAYNDPGAEADLAAYDSEFGLPACTHANGCFEQLNQRGQSAPLPFPQTAAELSDAREGDDAERVEEAEEATEWSIEMSLDIETAHGICESCRILLLEASAPLGSDLEEAESSAEALDATEISNSWAGPEEGETEAGEQHGPFDHPGTVITASAGDTGYMSWDSSDPGNVEFPASSPHVIAVGGTRLTLTGAGAWSGESVWNGDGAGGGGCSTVFKAPRWQLEVADWSAVGCGDKRAVADVSADADPYTGVAVEDSVGELCGSSREHWCTIGGTSLSSPLIAATFALAGGARGVAYPASTLYANARSTPDALHNVTAGSNGACGKSFNANTGLSRCTSAEESESCSGSAICLAGTGYNGPTGVGTPDGIADFAAPAGEEDSHEEAAPGEGDGSGEGSSGGSGSGAGGGETTPPEGGSGAGQPEGDDPRGGSGSSSGDGSGEGSGEGGETPVAGEAEPPSTAPGKRTHKPHEQTSCVLSELGLAPASAASARSAADVLSRLSFSFDASASSSVRVTLSRRRVTHGRARWTTVGRALLIEAARGRSSHTVALNGTLAPGTYRLGLRPRDGQSVSLVFEVR